MERGLRHIGGVDEAGRGPLAGPVVAAVVVLPVEWIRNGLPEELKGLNDSKQLPAARREEFFLFLTCAMSVRFAIARIDAATIDAVNILRATHRAMSQAVAELNPPAEHLLLDGLFVKSLLLPQIALVKGDSRSYSIAAASILAKVTRDRLMLEYDRAFPAYGFADHKGYGTAQHLAALNAHGPCPIHRRSFKPVRQPELELFPFKP
jgi:ribonuclease HII